MDFLVLSEVTQLCLTLCDPIDCSLPGSSIHGIFQARILEWVAIPSPGDLLDPGIEPGSLALWADSLTRDFFTFSCIRESILCLKCFETCLVFELCVTTLISAMFFLSLILRL